MLALSPQRSLATCLIPLLGVGACGGGAGLGGRGAAIDTSDPNAELDPSRLGDDVVPLPCHAWDPLDVDGGTRTYATTVGDQQGTETHTLGQSFRPRPVPDDTFAYRVVAAGPPATDVRIANACVAGDAPGAAEIGFDGQVAGVDMVALTSGGLKYLPTADALDFGRKPSWTSEARWAIDVDVEIPSCPSPLPLVRTTTSAFQVRGREEVDTPALGKVESVRLDVDLSERADARGNLSAICERALENLSIVGPGTRTDARAHRWYVRGVGLVVGLVVDPEDRACADPERGVVPDGCTPALHKRLTACSGLAGCP